MKYSTERKIETPGPVILPPPGDVQMISIADIHTSHQRPLARTDDDWYAAMDRTLAPVRKLARKHKCPVVCAGDIFHTWRSPPELINWAIKNLPQMYSIAGNHDLPFHRYDQMHKSPFWTLVQAGKITLLEPGKPISYGRVRLHGFPWGYPVKPLEEPHDLVIEVAVVHSYIWCKKATYQGAPKKSWYGTVRQQLRGYDVAVFGDNHKGFLIPSKREGEPTIYNNGCLIRRDSDERDYKVQVGLLHADGRITRIFLADDKAQWDSIERRQQKIQTGPVLDTLQNLTEVSLDFIKAVKQHCRDHDVPGDVQHVLTEEMEREE